MPAIRLFRHTAIALLLGSGVGCTVLTEEIEQVDTDTADLTTLVKAALVSDPNVDAAAILVTNDDRGAVVLSGFVDSEKQKQAAVTAARDASTSEVIDELELR